MLSIPSWTSVCSCVGLPHPSCLKMIFSDRGDRNKMEREKRWLPIIDYYCSIGLFSGRKEGRNKSRLSGSSLPRKQICANPLWLVKLKFPFILFLLLVNDFPCGSAGKESACNVGDLGQIPGLGRCPGKGKRIPTPISWPGEFHGLLQSMGRQESDMTERLSLFTIINHESQFIRTHPCNQ